MRDIDIRRELLAEMNRKHSLDPNTRVVPELGLCQGLARVDLAVVNGTLHGYEIKSERDTLARLPGQISVYNRTLEFVTIITAWNHADKVREIVPVWWGIWTVNSQGSGVKLESVRDAVRNPEVIPFSLVQLLWRDEALQALDDRGLADGLRGKPREQIWNRLAAELKLDELAEIVRENLKRRNPTWRALAQPA